MEGFTELPGTNGNVFKKITKEGISPIQPKTGQKVSYLSLKIFFTKLIII